MIYLKERVLTDCEIGFRIGVGVDWSLVFGEPGGPICTVTLNEWRTNKQIVENAFERAYRSKTN